MISTKSFSISKQIVWEAYKRVKANRGSAGIDDVTIDMFEQNLKGNLYKVWNRMSSGSYFPPPVKQVEIPKKDGSKRCLGIPTVSDRIAQMVVKLLMEPTIDSQFHPDSYGYRPGKSAKSAVEITRQRCWQYDWVVEFDIKGAFDNINHPLLMKAVKHHVKDRWIILYIERWLIAPFENVEGNLVSRKQGIPQGGVISPLLMNLFLHYTFDCWMERHYPQNLFARYADDAVVHCRSQEEAEGLLVKIGQRLNQCFLEIHPDKSKVIYCKDSNRRQRHPTTQFTFLGFTFRPRVAVNRTGQKFTSFLPAVSKDAMIRMRRIISRWNIQKQTPATIEELARNYNPTLLGWWHYYGSFYKTEMRKVYSHLDRKLAHWVRRKYKRLAKRKRASIYWLGKVGRNKPNLFVHWQKLGIPTTG